MRQVKPMLVKGLILFFIVFQLFGDASVAQSVLSNKENGDFFSINWGWAIGVMMGVLIAGGVSGKCRVPLPIRIAPSNISENFREQVLT